MTFVLPEPVDTDPRQAPVLRWGILAPGAIAADWVDAVHMHTDQRIVAAGSRDLGRAEAFCRAHGVERAYGSYEALVADPDVDVVYIASPHNLHLDQALLAIAAGKHVLVEKPLAVTVADGRRIAEAARAAGVFALEAMWSRFLPQTGMIARLLADGAIGTPSLATADFCGAPVTDPDSRLLDPARAGGALLDIGVYVAWWSRFALGPATSVAARGALSDRGVDLQASLLLEASGAQALLTCGWRGRTAWSAAVVGDRFRIEVEPPFCGPNGFRVTGADASVVAAWTDPFDRPWRSAFAYEAAATARCIGAGLLEAPEHPMGAAIDVLEVLDAARRQIGTVV